MQSLVDLSVDKILKTLPLDCQTLLAEHLLKDRVYNLATYISSYEQPQDGCFLVFRQNPDLTYECLGLTCHPDSYCYMNQADLSPDAINTSKYTVYYIPDSGYNNVIILESPMTRQSKVYVSLRHHQDGDSVREIKTRTQEDISEWKEYGSPKFPITYYISSK